MTDLHKAAIESECATPLTVALLALPETTAGTLYGMFELFASAGRDWDFLVTGKPGPSKARPIVVSPDGRRFRAANGIWVQPDHSFETCPPAELICISDLFVAPGEEIAGRYDAAIAWLRRREAEGVTLAAACSGALLLAEAGLLDGRDATTHWGYCDGLARRYPKVNLHPARVLVATGDGQRVITSGGGTSWQDLALFLIARFLGLEEAMRLARVYLMDWHRHGQLPFAALSGAQQVEDATIAACQEWIAENYMTSSPVAAMVQRSEMAERSFKRRFASVTGMSPMDYVHTLRLEEAKQLLETSDLAVEAVANEVGYEDASFFRRLFRRKVGITPTDYRRRFGGFRRALQAVSGVAAE